MKVTKTQEASVSVIKAAEKQADNKLKARAWQQDVERLKKQKSTQAWFQRFAWFVSSEGYLIVAPRDKGQCEQVVFGGVLRPTDALVLCEQNGPPTVVRARDGVLSPLALHEAGCFAACRSDAWQRRDSAPAYWVPGFSVRKVGSSNSSQVLDVLGDVAISSGTKKTYLPPTQLELTFALLFKLSDDSLEAHSGDRPGRVPDEELLRLTPSEEATDTDEEEVTPVVVEDALPPAPEPHFARTGLCGNRRAYRPRGQCRVDGVESPRHRAMAWGARNLISTQVPANSRRGSASSSRSLAVISTPCAKPNKSVLGVEQERVGGRRRPSLCR